MSSGYTVASSVRHSDGFVSDEQTFTPDRSFVFLTEKNSVKLVGNSPTSKSNLESLSQSLILHCCWRPDISQSRAATSPSPLREE